MSAPKYIVTTDTVPDPRQLDLFPGQDMVLALPKDAVGGGQNLAQRAVIRTVCMDCGAPIFRPTWQRGPGYCKLHWTV